jgi:hypothetical protein
VTPNRRLLDVRPTVLIARTDGGLRQLVRVTVGNPGDALACAIVAEWAGGRAEVPLDAVASGESRHELLLPVPQEPRDATFSLIAGGTVADGRQVSWRPPPRLRVHVVQHSHHDVGYTNLPSTVRREHCRFLEDALDLAEATSGHPPEARFRLVIEQAWSLLEFARSARPEHLARMGELLRRGDLELTALFGNLTTEICGPEELVRALYPSARLARRFGCAIVSAEHNDVPGMSWGLAEVLVGAGIRLFCPQLPRYWSWCDPPMQGFWDESVLLPRGRPGGFWWEAPSGGRVLLWDAHGTGGDVRPDLPGLADRLQGLVDAGYPYWSVYWPVRGGARDNSPYVAGFCDTVRDWNARWAFPQLLVSTNAGFHADLEPELPDDLPVFRGELPGQDYPVGSMSTAAATAVNRNNHVQLLVAEALATLAAQTTDHRVATEALDEAYEDTLWFNEHTWGHHFPAGPAADASSLEKQTHAFRAAALAQDVTVQALARIADHVDLPGDGLFLVVWNPLPHVRTAPVSTPLREVENCGSTMARLHDPEAPEAPGYLRGVALTDRWHLHPPAEIVAGAFELVDLATRQVVEYELIDLAADSPVPHAPQRHGLSHGGKRYGFFEAPSGLNRDLQFVAQDLPACGYKAYQLRPLEQMPPARGPRPRAELVIENRYFRVQADRDTGRMVSLIDREADRELLDPHAPHGLGELVVRTPYGVLEPPGVTAAPWAETTPVAQRLHWQNSAPGHPHLRFTLTLYEESRRLDLSLRMLKDATPLLDAHLAFPFAFSRPRFRYESLLALQTPPEDFLPGAYWDEVAVQNWVQISDGAVSVLWSSLDAPLVSLGRLTPGYTSPAHRCRVPDDMEHPPGTAEQLERGWLYSLLCANNFGTNFAVSQTGSLLFRYRITTGSGAMTDGEATRLGWEAVTPPETVFTPGRGLGPLPLSGSFLSLEGDPLVLLAAKPAEVGEGLILRCWNPTAQAANATVRLGFGDLKSARVIPLTEGDAAVSGAEAQVVDARAVSLRFAPRALATVGLTVEPRPDAGLKS